MGTRKLIRGAKIQRTYRTLVWVFAGLVVCLIAFIVYFSFSRTVIWITPRSEPKTLSTLIEVTGSTTAGESSAIPAIIVKKEASLTKSFQASSEISEVPAKATGVIRIQNNYSKAQPLIAGTRLLSESGKLFRTTERVDVPVGGFVDATVVADEVGKAFEIGPSRFTLPALWPGLQDKIFGNSLAAMTGGTIKTSIATLDDIISAKKETRDEVFSQLRDTLSSQIKTVDSDAKILGEIREVSSESATVQPGDLAAMFEVTVVAHLTALSFDEALIADEIVELAKGQLTDDVEFTVSPDQTYEFEVESYLAEQNTASVRVSIPGVTRVKLSNPIFNRGSITNRDRQEIQTYFSRFDEIESVEVNFSPFWVFRTPTLADHIEIKLRPVE